LIHWSLLYRKSSTW